MEIFQATQSFVYKLLIVCFNSFFLKTMNPCKFETQSNFQLDHLFYDCKLKCFSLYKSFLVVLVCSYFLLSSYFVTFINYSFKIYIILAQETKPAKRTVLSETKTPTLTSVTSSPKTWGFLDIAGACIFSIVLVGVCLLAICCFCKCIRLTGSASPTNVWGERLCLLKSWNPWMITIITLLYACSHNGYIQVSLSFK